MGRIVIRGKRRNSLRGAGRIANPDASVDATLGENDGVGNTDAGESVSSDGIGPGDDSGVDSGASGNSERFVNPASAASGDSGTGTRRRGRPPGSRNGTRKATVTETSRNIGEMLFSLHLGMATFLSSEHWAITEDEADRLGKAIIRVTQCYNINVLSEEQLAWVNLAMVAVPIYGTRAFLSVQSKKEKPKIVSKQPVTIGEAQVQ